MAKNVPDEKENNTLLYAALGVAAVLLVGAVVAMKFIMRPPPARRPTARP